MSEKQLEFSAPLQDLQEGQSFRSEMREVREADVVAFCALSGDWHPQHWDANWAASSPFGQRIAHGMLVLSLAVGLVPFDPARVRALRRVSETVFKRPVRFGEQICVTCELQGLSPVDESVGLVDVRLSVRNGEDALIARGGVQVLWTTDLEPLEDAAYWQSALPESARAPGRVSVPM
jgi:3-hydroxybutyryl-CoA dehydratase